MLTIAVSLIAFGLGGIVGTCSAHDEDTPDFIIAYIAIMVGGILGLSLVY